jgi:EAL domain-containing protein (putative c-di-GMP-specific phosphodiesterase class I)/ActR/RegA family two-component response regulator
MKEQVMERGHILLADDDAVVARSLSRLLERAGYRVDAAPDGAVAATILKGDTFDLILSDISMPAMGGIDLLRVVREYDLDIPVILMTAGPDVRTAIRAIEHGALRYLTKPIEKDELISEVEYGVRMGRLARLKREALLHIGDLDKFVGDRAGLESRFLRAVQQIGMAYQPIVSWSTKTVYAHEALVRSREATLPHPGALFDAAERTGRLCDLGRAIRTAIARDVIESSGTIFVNLHPRDLDDPDLFTPAAPLSRVASRTVLEITERASLEDIKDVRGRIGELRKLGFRIAVDDLGAGYAGLTTFAHLQPDFAKLDMSLVRNIDRDDTKQRVVRTMAKLCRELGVLVVAEGIETPAERDMVVELGCDLLQGYLFAKPGPAFPAVAL